MPTAHIEASKPIAITKYQFPVAVVTNHYKLNDVKQHKCIILQFWRLKVQKGSDRAEAKWQQSCVPSETPVRSIFLPFQVLEAACHPRLRTLLTISTPAA